MRTAFTIEGCEWVTPDEKTLVVTGFYRVETDGIGLHHGDKTADNHTTYQPDLNADKVRFVSVPMVVAHTFPGAFIGCLVEVEDELNNRKFNAVCGDLAPNNRTGEGSYKLAIDFGVDPNPNTGGYDEAHKFKYTFHPGVPCPGFTLQPLHRS